ncbi:MAG: uL30 family ribosomal protein [archaeon]|mgnify:CR=1 FL=1|jgi:large subunit ribosomal protein L30
MMYAVIRIRGTVNISPKIETALTIMNLRRINNLSIWPENDHTKKMIKVVKDYTTFGIINDSVLEELIKLKAKPIIGGQKIDSKKIVEEIKKGKKLKDLGIKNCFNLSPPKKGFERKGIKVAYKIGGALGDRKEEINSLIMRML